MKKITHFKRIFAVMLCFVMMLSIASVSVSAAKEMFTTYQIDDVTITGIDAPTAGKAFDFTAEENSQKYNVIKVAWMTQNGHDYITSASATASAGKKYTVYVVLEVATPSHYFMTGEGRVSAVSSVTVNGNTANASNTQDYSLFSVDASKYEHDTTYQKYLVVMYTFPETEAAPIESVEFGVPELIPGERVPTTWQASGISIDGINGNENNGQVNVNKFEWSLQDGTTLAGNAVFEYGKKYSLKLTLGTAYGASFATDPNHFFAQPGKPFPTVTITMNGQSATVLPTYDSYSNMYVVAACVFDCDTAAKVTKIELTGIDTPVAGKAPDYTFVGGTGYENNGRNDAYYKDGVCWSEVGSSYIVCDGTHAFLPGKAYQVDIRIKAKDGYEFATNSYGNVSMTATVNGENATISGNKNEILVTYEFSATENVVLNKVGVTDIDAPKTGELPDYSAEYTNINYGAAENGIFWYNETDKKVMSASEKFEGGKIYTVHASIKANDGYEFSSKSGVINVSGTVNDKSAKLDASGSDSKTVVICYTFPKTEAHKCSAEKIDEIKATCQKEGKKAYYYCSECKKYFEDSKCSKGITDIDTWGIIEKTEHTGGKATCDNRAICKNCGEYYGELAEHKFGTSWESNGDAGHGHKCKECGTFDEMKPHNGGTAKCGELAKCADCKEEYGEVMQHQWSSDWTFTDSKGHAHKCTVCGEHDTIIEHSGGTADCQNKAKCAVCGTEYGKTGDHKWGTEWDYKSRTGHAHICTVNGCDEHDTVVKHTPGAAATAESAQICTACNYVIAPKTTHTHNLTKIDALEATCTTAGKQAYYSCDSCDSIFSDSKGKNEITDDSELIIPAKGHKESKWKYDEDTHWKECTAKGCDEIIDGTKLAHNFDENDKCTDCKYKRGDDPALTSEADGEDTQNSDTADTGKDTSESEAQENTGEEGSSKWIIMAAIIAVLAVAVIALTVVVLKKNRKK